MQGSYAKAISMGYVLGSKPSGEQGFVRTADNATKLRQRKKKSQNKKDSPSGSLMFGSGFSFGSQLISYSTKKSYPEAQK